jgi:GNAT superfamily N-acetyltransferase
MSNGGYIALFSTHPAYRQQGLGSAVVNAVKQRADKVMVVTQNRELVRGNRLSARRSARWFRKAYV